MFTSLAGRAVVVTGGTRGIGKGIASVFARNGARVLITGRDSDVARTAAEELSAGGAEVSFIQADVSDREDCRRMAANAVEPGWVATKMGGAGAPDDLTLGPLTQVWLAASPETADITGGYFYHQRPRRPAPLAHDDELQKLLLESCASLTGVTLAQ